MALVPKTQVLEITCPEDVPAPDPDRVTAAKQVELEVIFPGGAEYRGHATLELPPGPAADARLHERRRAASSRSGPMAGPATSTSCTSDSSVPSTEIRRGPTRPVHPSHARAARRRAAAGRGPAGRAGDQRRHPRDHPGPVERRADRRPGAGDRGARGGGAGGRRRPGDVRLSLAERRGAGRAHARARRARAASACARARAAAAAAKGPDLSEARGEIEGLLRLLVRGGGVRPAPPLGRAAAAPAPRRAGSRAERPRSRPSGWRRCW